MNEETPQQRNPFPGLRPFREDEEYLFFGRESQVDAMVDKLASRRFLAVVGTSGSGKSSLVNCGLRPALHRGLMADAGSVWRMAQMRPGSNPIASLAKSLSENGVLFSDFDESDMPLTEIVETTLRMSKLGLVDIFEQADLGEEENLLVVVDQFEELFRYRNLGTSQGKRSSSVGEDAIAFVNLLLEASEQRELPIYIVLTMRSDFLGDCAQFFGLAEAISDGQYLVPRLTRDQRRAAISGPINVGGATISPVLLTRLVNDVGDDPDQLSILQHALNRTWARWYFEGGANGSIDLSDYESVGTMAHALDQHADKAYQELTDSKQRQICESLFRTLTDKATDPRGVRRPTKLSTLCTLAGASQEEVTDVIDVFRQPSRSFLMPPAGEDLEPDTIIDISHESLMRVWNRLKNWSSKEARSAQIFERLASTADLYREDKASLLRDQDLQRAVSWKNREMPIEAWANLYRDGFHEAMGFLRKSQEDQARRVAEQEFARKLRILRTAIAGLIIGSFLVGPIGTVRKENPLRFDSEPIESIAEIDVEGDPHVVVFIPASSVTRVQNKLAQKDGVHDSFAEYLSASTAVTEDDHGRIMQALRVGPLAVIHSAEAADRATMGYAAQSARERARAVDLEPDVVATLPVSLTNDFESDDRDALREQNVISVPDAQYLAGDQLVIYVLPSRSFAMAPVPAQGEMIKSALQIPEFESFSMRYPLATEMLLEVLRLVTHVLLYLALIFGVGAAYRRLSLAPVVGVEQSSAQRRLEEVSATVANFIASLGRGRSAWVLTAGALVVGVGLLVQGIVTHIGGRSGWLGDFRFGMFLGLLTILLLPLGPLLPRAAARRVSRYQGKALRIWGYYSLVGVALGVFLLFVDGDVLNFGMLLSPNPLLGTAFSLLLIASGWRKNYLDPAEIVESQPDKAPVIYLRFSDRIPSRWQDKHHKWLSPSMRPVDEQVVSYLFAPLGPVVSVGHKWAPMIDPPYDADPESVDQERKRAFDFLRSANLVVIQIDERMSNRFNLFIEKLLGELRPDQALLYFSQQIEADQLNGVYRRFAADVQGAIARPLPPALGSDRIIYFLDDEEPATIGSVSEPRFNWTRVTPWIGQKFRVSTIRKSMSRSLEAFYRLKGAEPMECRLFSDRAIGTMGFSIPAATIPAGILIFLNLWRLKRRKTAFVGLLAPTATLILVIVGLIYLESAVGRRLQFEFVALMFLLLLAAPAICIRLWRSLSRNQARFHQVTGGAIKSAWKTVLVLTVVSAVLGGSYSYLILNQVPYRERYYMAEQAEYLVYEAQSVAWEKDVDYAIDLYREAQSLYPDIDLDPLTSQFDSDPETVAMSYLAQRLVFDAERQAMAGEIEAATDNLMEAVRLRPDIDLNRFTSTVDTDPAAAALALSGRTPLTEAEWSARNGDIAGARNKYDAILVVNPSADLNPRTERVDQSSNAVAEMWRAEEIATHPNEWQVSIVHYANAVAADAGLDLNSHTASVDRDPHAIALMWRAQRLAQHGELEEAIRTFDSALKRDRGLDLSWYSDTLDQDPEAVARQFQAIGQVGLGTRLAIEQDITGAITHFDEALQIDPSIDLNWVDDDTNQYPRDAAERLGSIGEAFLETGVPENLAEIPRLNWPPNVIDRVASYDKAWERAVEGNRVLLSEGLDEAIDIYREARAINPGINLAYTGAELVTELREEDRRDAAKFLVSEGDEAAVAQDIESAEIHYQLASAIDPTLDLDPDTRNRDRKAMMRAERLSTATEK